MIKGIVIGLLLGLGIIEFIVVSMKYKANDRDSFERLAIRIAFWGLVWVILLLTIYFIL